MNKEALFLQNVSTNDSRVQNIKYVSLYLKQGEILGITGLNGGGMTRLADLLCGRMQPSGGEIFLGEKQITIENENTARSAGIIEIKEYGAIIPLMTVGENLFFPFMKTGKYFAGKKYFQVLAEDMFTEYQLDISVAEMAERLSRAQKIEVEICRAIRNHAQILILHELGDGFSETEIQECKRLLERICAEGMSVIFMNSNPELLLRFSDRCIVFRDGRICYEEDRNRVSLKEIQNSMAIQAMRRASTDYQTETTKTKYTFEHIYLNEWNADVSFSLHPGRITKYIWKTQGDDLFYDAFTGTLDVMGVVREDNKTVSFQQWRQKHASELLVLKKRFWSDMIYPNMTVGENIALPTYRRFHRSAMIINYKMIDLALKDFMNQYRLDPEMLLQYPRNLNLSDQNKIVIWRMLFSPPSILVLDSPCYAMDEETKQYFSDCLKVLKEMGTAILWSENNEMAINEKNNYNSDKKNE